MTVRIKRLRRVIRSTLLESKRFSSYEELEDWARRALNSGYIDELVDYIEKNTAGDLKDVLLGDLQDALEIERLGPDGVERAYLAGGEEADDMEWTEAGAQRFYGNLRGIKI